MGLTGLGFGLGPKLEIRHEPIYFKEDICTQALDKVYIQLKPFQFIEIDRCNLVQKFL